jgi:protein-tyrosine phosphatase
LIEEADLPPGVTKIQVAGSFNYWKPSEFWTLRRENVGRWILDLPPGRVEAPGNSGYPEYQFLLNDSVIMGANFFPDEPRIGNNFLIIPSQDSKVWLDRIRDLTRPKPLEGNEQNWLCNCWEVGGGKLAPQRLFRSSHPFLTALPDERESSRIKTVNELWNAYRVTDIINLADGEAVIFDKTCPKPYAMAARDGHVLFLPLEYQLVYYHTRGNLFQSAVGKILTFIAQTRGPWMVHCRLGIDRTGVIVALLQALAGATWQEIIKDYSRTAVFNPTEYRHPDLLAYCFKRLISQHPETSPDLVQAMKNSLARSVAHQEILNQAITNLTQPV